MSALPRLSLAHLPRTAALPAYDRAGLTHGIVHLGIGAFHRAHQAMMTDDALAAGASDWGIIGASLRSPDTRDALKPQDGLYTVSVRDGSGERLRIIGAVLDVLVAPEEPEALLALMVDARTRIVTLTVTEKGYCHLPASGTLDEAHPDVVHDLAHPQRPRSAPGFIVEALARRRAAGLAPFTVLSCDNLPANGRTLKRVLTRLAALRDPALGEWIEQSLACPCSMVDRIVPATTDAERARISAALGVEDAWPVVTEPFSQWAIEDHFPLGRPRWEAGGAQFVADVVPFEHMKLRMLNGAHSSLAYLGFLAGHEFVADAADDPAFARFLSGLWAEIIPTVPAPPGVDLEAYAQALLARFRNPTIRHRLWQIAMDGSQKLPQRLLGTIADNLKAGRAIDHLCLGVAGFAAYVSGSDEHGQPIDVRDPMAAELKAAMHDFRADPRQAVERLLAIGAIFGGELPADERFRAALTAALEKVAGGAKAALSS